MATRHGTTLLDLPRGSCRDRRPLSDRPLGVQRLGSAFSDGTVIVICSAGSSLPPDACSLTLGWPATTPASCLAISVPRRVGASRPRHLAAAFRAFFGRTCFALRSGVVGRDVFRHRAAGAALGTNPVAPTSYRRSASCRQGSANPHRMTISRLTTSTDAARLSVALLHNARRR
jgi:hypothetical protein